jgi:glycosyl transferase family 25
MTPAAPPMPVYVVNLPRDSERMQRMASQLDALGLPFERIDAVLGRALGDAERAALYDAQRNRRLFHDPLVPGEIGCYASHLKAWQRLVDDRLADAALVLEDDVLLRPLLVPVLQAVAALPPRWDMVKLIGRDRESPWRTWPLAEGVKLIRYRRVPSLTSAYIVSRAGATKLLARRKPFFRPIDTDLRHWWECDLRVYGTQPYPVAHGPDAAHSSIGRRELTDAFGHRWRKVRDQWRYSVGALRANRQLRDDDPFSAT